MAMLIFRLTEMLERGVIADDKHGKRRHVAATVDRVVVCYRPGSYLTLLTSARTDGTNRPQFPPTVGQLAVSCNNPKFMLRSRSGEMISHYV